MYADNGSVTRHKFVLFTLDGKQVEVINSRISLMDFVPNSPTSTQIYVTGKCIDVSLNHSNTSSFILAIIGPSLVEMFTGREQVNKLENDINGDSMGRLIYQPGGCGEENMIHTSLTVIATRYLDQTNQWEAVNIERRNEALQHIRTGGLGLYLAYRHWSEGSMSVNVTCLLM